MMPHIRIETVADTRNFETARELLVEYQKDLGIDLCFQGFTEELERLSSIYAPPAGCLLLAKLGDEVVGCVAFRVRADAECEMKRLYVRSGERGLHVGRLLAEALIERARADGHRRMILDTLESMTAARELYRSLGFTMCPPYHASPLAGTIYMSLELTSGGASSSATA